MDKRCNILHSDYFQRDEEDEFYSSLDSDDETKENPFERIVRQKIMVNINEENNSNDNRRNEISWREMMQKINEYKQRIQNKNFQNIKINWMVVYKLLFSSYLNQTLTRKKNLNYSTQSGNLFNFNEMELRIKSLIQKSETQNEKIIIIKEDNENKKEINELLEEEKSFHHPKWNALTLSQILKPKHFTEEEIGNFVPYFLNEFHLFMDKETEKLKKEEKIHENEKKQSKLYRGSLPLPKFDCPKESKFQKKKVNRMPNMIITKEEVLNSEHNYKESKSPKVQSFPLRFNDINKSQYKMMQSKKNNNIQMLKYIELLKKNKFITTKMKGKYPEYENEIQNLAYYYKTYEYQLNKDMNILKQESNAYSKTFIDFISDKEAQQNAKISKRFVLRDKFIKQAKVIDKFINEFHCFIETFSSQDNQLSEN